MAKKSAAAKPVMAAKGQAPAVKRIIAAGPSKSMPNSRTRPGAIDTPKPKITAAVKPMMSNKPTPAGAMKPITRPMPAGANKKVKMIKPPKPGKGKNPKKFKVI